MFSGTKLYALGKKNTPIVGFISRELIFFLKSPIRSQTFSIVNLKQQELTSLAGGFNEDPLLAATMPDQLINKSKLSPLWGGDNISLATKTWQSSVR